MSRLFAVLLPIAAVVVTALPANAQITAAFRYSTTDSGGLVAIAPNDLLALPTVTIGESSTATLLAENRGNSTWTVSSAIVSDTSFRLTLPPSNPVTPAGSAPFTIRFTGVTRGDTNGTLTIVLTGDNNQTANFTFRLRGRVQAPDSITSYIRLPDGNQTAVRNGEAIAFGPAAVGGTVTANFVITNRGDASSNLTVVNVTGDRFRLTGLPLLPAQIRPAAELRFSVIFQPTSVGDATGTLAITLDGQPITFRLTGSGSSAQLRFESRAGDDTVTVAPGGRISFQAVEIGRTATVRMTLTNAGNAEARVAAIAATGAIFRLTEVPALPLTLAPGQQATVVITATPAEAGLTLGSLRFDTTSFDLAATGIGARLSLSAVVGDLTIPVDAGGTINFPNTVAGTRSQIRVRVANAGNAPGSLSSITASGGPFSTDRLPALPAVIAPDNTVEFDLRYSPVSLETSAGTLRLDDRVYNLRGVGTSPPPLPASAFAGAPAQVQPLDQPSIGLTLAEPYSIELTGRLNMTFTSESFADDPSIQFAPGGRAAEFRIPAGSREAIFTAGGNRIPMQVGTVAGTIAVVPQFNVGTVDITPNGPPRLSLVIAPAAPVLRSVRLGTVSANSFELLVTGFATNRALTQMALTFEPNTGARLDTTSLTANVDPVFSSWYQGTASRPFGSQFTASLVIQVSGRVEDVRAVSVTAVNGVGRSNTVNATLR